MQPSFPGNAALACCLILLGIYQPYKLHYLYESFDTGFPHARLGTASVSEWSTTRTLKLGSLSKALCHDQLHAEFGAGAVCGPLLWFL